MKKYLLGWKVSCNLEVLCVLSRRMVVNLGAGNFMLYGWNKKAKETEKKVPGTIVFGTKIAL